MAHPGEKLANSLEFLKDFQETNGLFAFKSSDLTRTHRERLSKNGFLRQVVKGWYITTDPTESAGNSTSWYTSYWQFCSQYLNDKYGTNYCISAEQSILIHSGNTTVPKQMIIRSSDAPNKVIPLIHDSSLFEMKSTLPDMAEIVEINGLRTVSLISALINCSPTMFDKNPTDMRAALAMVSDASELLGQLLDGSHSVIAGRLAGAFRNICNERIANEILSTMKMADFKVREVDPFTYKTSTTLSLREKSPYTNRIRLMWETYRMDIIKCFPELPKIQKSKEDYLKTIEEIYLTDAYHSLSIEKYKVSVELIEKVKSGNWSIEQNEEDKNHRDAMAARGYWQAAQSVKNSIEKVLNGCNSGVITDEDHTKWYQELFAPSVSVGILKPSDLAGYRTNQVYISNSQHVPLNKDAVRDAMPAFFELLKSEQHTGVRSILGHFIFVYIHPYMDGNGRMARFLMNVMLASGGYPWTVIPVQESDAYMNALEKASVEGDIEPFAKFISDLVQQSLDGKPLAKI